MWDTNRKGKWIMLNTLKERLPDGMEIKKVKEKSSKYEIIFLIDGKDIKSELPKTCTPGMQNRVADHTIINAMVINAMHNGDMETAKKWLDKLLPPSE
jgi:hypothetical protein